MAWPCWCARAWVKILSVAVCMSFVTVEGTGSKFSFGKRGDTGYVPGGLRKGLFGGRKRKEPAHATDGRNCCCCWEASILSWTLSSLSAFLMGRDEREP